MKKHKVNPKMIILGRETRGLSQSELASKLGISQGKLSKIESGFLGLSENKMLEQLQKILHYPKDFFLEPGEIYTPNIDFYRKYAKLPTKELNRIGAVVDLQRIHIQKLLHSTEFVEDRIQERDIDEYGSPEVIAQIVRDYLQIPRGPVENLTKHIEDAGVIVIDYDFGSEQFFGTKKRTEKQQDIIFINKNMTGDRWKFTLAHELGHIIMHRFPKTNAESEADQFASELLMPEKEIKPQLTKLTLEKLANLKLFWKVSMASLLFRAHYLGVITQRHYRYLWTQISKYGYKRREPIELDIPKEKPSLMDEIIKLHMDELGYSISDLSKLVLLYEDEFLNLYTQNNTLGDKKHLRVVQ